MGLLKEPYACALDRHCAAASARHPSQLPVSVTVSPDRVPSSSVCAGPKAAGSRGKRALAVVAAAVTASAMGGDAFGLAPEHAIACRAAETADIAASAKALTA